MQIVSSCFLVLNAETFCVKRQSTGKAKQNDFSPGFLVVDGATSQKIRSFS